MYFRRAQKFIPRQKIMKKNAFQAEVLFKMLYFVNTFIIFLFCPLNRTVHSLSVEK